MYMMDYNKLLIYSYNRTMQWYNVSPIIKVAYDIISDTIA